MRSKKISEWRLAAETGLSQSTINAILTGRSREQKDSTLEPIAGDRTAFLKKPFDMAELSGKVESLFTDIRSG